MTHVEMHLMSSLAWEGLGPQILRSFLCSLRYGLRLFIICYGGHSARADMVVFGQHMLRYILCYRWNMRFLRNTCRDAICDLVVIGWVWSSNDELLFVFSLAKDGFEHHVLIYFLRIRWQ